MSVAPNGERAAKAAKASAISLLAGATKFFVSATAFRSTAINWTRSLAGSPANRLFSASIPLTR